ncbi:MAG: hypothetical protein HKN87_21205 [Saprospiraceae bacterium]|nr:hypothetical protein [Saprospiraceae bacterium]
MLDVLFFQVKSLYFPKISPWIFTGLFLLMAFQYDYDRILFEPPQSIHQWRQADCLSLTMNYYQDGNPFFQPSMHYLGIDGTGKTVSEFPILYYLVGKIWTITGKEVWVYRLMVLLLFLIGLLALMKTIEVEIENSVAGIFVGLLLFTSPVLVYYGGNFLMNIPAFSFACLGLYQFFKFKASGMHRHLGLLLFFFTLAGLLKVSALLSFVAICLVYLIDVMRLRSKHHRIFQGTWKEGLGLLSVFVISYMWVRYAQGYNAQHTGGIFLIGILPIWDLSYETIAKTYEYVADRFIWDYFMPYIEKFLAICAIIVLIFYRGIESSVRFIFGMMCIGALAFIVLFFEALMHHDYYIIDLYMLVPILLLATFMVVKAKVPLLYRSWILVGFLIWMTVRSFQFAQDRLYERYDFQGWRNHDHREVFHAFTELEPTLQKLGIEPDDRVLSLSDYSINITLYLMNRKGWTDYGISMDPERIKDKIKLGAQYLFIANPRTYEHESVQPFIHGKIGHYRNIDIYRLNEIDFYR